MEKRRSIVAEIIGVICLLIGLFMGVFLFFYALVITISAMTVLSDTTYDATGLSMMVGQIAIIYGIVFSFLLIPAARLLNLRPKHLILFVTIVALSSSIFGIGVEISYKLKIDRERKQDEEKVERRDKEILDQFENHQYAVLMVICRIRPHIEEKDIDNNIEAIQSREKEFAIENIIKPLGQNISNYQFHGWGSYDIYFIADVTRDGYESLKENQHVWKIELNSSFQKKCRISAKEK